MSIERDMLDAQRAGRVAGEQGATIANNPHTGDDDRTRLLRDRWVRGLMSTRSEPDYS